MQSVGEPVQPFGEDIHLIATKPINPRFTREQVLHFALCANPIKRLKDARCRVPLIREDEQFSWLERKIEEAAQLLECQVSAIHPIHFRKDIRSAPGKILAVTFTGFLQVIEPMSLLALMKNGIGPAKSFGCGLLTLARA
jgi:CRISPR system Cascade subunit CasE